jgi:hypothetical protein
MRIAGRDIPHPLCLSLIHRLQIENALLRLYHGNDLKQAKIAKDGLRTWRQYLAEQVLVIQHFELEPVFAKAARWNEVFSSEPPKWSLLLHPALAATVQATFMSFDPVLRQQAAGEGLALLPARL